MEDYQKRVVKERKDLVAKRDKLVAFLEADDNIDPTEKDLLEMQKMVMRRYSNILQRRIDLFGTS